MTDKLNKFCLVFVFSVLVLIFGPGVQAQSCGDSYYHRTETYATCPTNKACANTSCNYTQSTVTRSCGYDALLGYMGASPACSVHAGDTICVWDSCNLATGTHLCHVETASWYAAGVDPYQMGCSWCPYGAWTNTTCGGSCAPNMKEQARTSSTAQSVCQRQTRCVADAACSDPKPPTNPSGSCATTNTVNLSWDSMASATYYALRVDDTTTGGWDGTCSGGGDFCANVGPASYSFTGTLNHSYNWWVHACNGNTGICSASTGGPAFSCLGTPPTPTYTPTPTFTPSPTPTTAPPAAYFKVKNTSFYKLGNLSSPVPATATAYDASDVAPYTVFNQGVFTSGIVAAPTSIDVGLGTTISSSGWSRAPQTIPSTFTAASFKSYVMTKKSATTLNTLSSDLHEIVTPGLYYYNGDLTISADIAQNNVVLVVNGNVTINGSGAPVKFNGVNRPFALVVSGSPAKTLTFADALTEADGLFIADDVQFSTNESFPSTTPLKIVGNVSSATSVGVIRARSATPTAPSLFIVFDPTQYVGLFDKLSVVKSSWTQIQ